MARKKKSDSRIAADVFACFGFIPGYKWTRFGLWLNTVRARTQWAAAVLTGHSASLSKEQLDPIWGDAMAPLPEEADELTFAMNEARAMANVTFR